MKAMLLAAGRGMRLRPLTDHTPKPLLRVGNETLIERHVRLLTAIGVTDIVINLHHLGEQIANALANKGRFATRLHLLHEPALLETGGGIANALHLLDDGPFIVISADLWTEYPLQQLRTPLGPGRLARLVMVRSPLSADFGFQHPPIEARVAPLIVDAESKLTYANLSVLDPALFRHAPSGAFPLRQLLFPALAADQLEGELYSGPWFNVGDLQELTALRAYVSQHDGNA